MSSQLDPQSSRVVAWMWKILAIVLWLFTVILGLACIDLGREIALRIYADFSLDPGPAALINWVIIFVLAICWLSYTIGAGEYHWKHVGESSSWTIFAWAVAIELLIMILYFVV